MFETSLLCLRLIVFSIKRNKKGGKGGKILDMFLLISAGCDNIPSNFTVSDLFSRRTQVINRADMWRSRQKKNLFNFIWTKLI